MGLGAWKAGAVGAVAGIVVALAAARGADAKAAYESPYGYDRTWNAALRLVRVDNGWKINEKDEGSGYLLFEYKSPENSKPTPGSIELVRGHSAEDPISVLVQLPQMPHYHEQVLLDSLSAKMRHEYGDPPVKKKKPPTQDPGPEPADAGVDGGG
jgi:hypothetical protein